MARSWQNTFPKRIAYMAYKVKIWLLFAYTLLVIVTAIILGPIPQNAAYHSFADIRKLLGIPNLLNVVSNLPFLIVGIYGVILVFKSSVWKSISVIYYLLFFGILLIGIGSAYYHLHPNNERLVWDRIPMTVVFMAFLSATIAEYINPKIACRLLFPLIVNGILSVIWWIYTERLGKGDLRYYGAVQFYPVGFIIVMLILFPSDTNRRNLGLFGWIVVWYILAKACEHFDREIFHRTGLISGHSLKHLGAAISTAFMAKMYKVKYPK